MGLVSPMILGAETPVNVGKDWFIFETYYSEDTAAYS